MSESGWSLAIDFGTSFTTAATMAGDQPPAVVEVEQSRYFPSVVVVDSAGQFLTGRAAVQQAAVFPERAVRVPKRALVAGPEVLLPDGPVAVTDLVAAVLRRMVSEATVRHGGLSLERVVLTHPARWDAVPLDRLREAAAKAGITGPQLMPEPVAAAWRFARPSGEDGKNGKDGLVGVFDFGGGTLDTAVLRAAGGGYEIAGRPGGDATLGGEDFDEMLLEHVMELVRDRDEEKWEATLAGSGLQARRSVALLRADVRVAKEALSEYLTYDVAVPGFAEGFRLTRQEFNDLIGDRLDGAVAEMRKTLEEAGAAPGQLAGMYLSGGSSRIPAVAERLAAGLDGVVPQLRDDPKAAVALGALAAIMPPRKVIEGVITRRPVTDPAWLVAVQNGVKALVRGTGSSPRPAEPAGGSVDPAWLVAVQAWGKALATNAGAFLAAVALAARTAYQRSRPRLASAAAISQRQLAKVGRPPTRPALPSASGQRVVDRLEVLANNPGVPGRAEGQRVLGDPPGSDPLDQAGADLTE